MIRWRFEVRDAGDVEREDVEIIYSDCEATAALAFIAGRSDAYVPAVVKVKGENGVTVDFTAGELLDPWAEILP